MHALEQFINTICLKSLYENMMLETVRACVLHFHWLELCAWISNFEVEKYIIARYCLVGCLPTRFFPNTFPS